MRRKTFDVLFETRDGMRLLVQERCMWRSLWYFALSVGLFSGVVTNQLFLDQALSVRFAVIAAAVSIAGVVLSMYGFLLHGILETLGAISKKVLPDGSKILGLEENRKEDLLIAKDLLLAEAKKKGYVK